MNRIALFSPIVVLFLFSGGLAKAQTIVPVRLADVRSVYVDEHSFKIVSSSCASYYGGFLLPCAKHSNERKQFLVALKRWLGKSGFAVVERKEDAEAILDGTLSIDEHPGNDELARPGKHHENREREFESYEPRWTVDGWMTNQEGKRLWRLGFGYPRISYTGQRPKIEGKKLAKAVEYDAKHHI